MDRRFLEAAPRRGPGELLQEGHLWGKKDVAIPISAVTRVDDGIALNIAKKDVENLPSVDIDHPTG